MSEPNYVERPGKEGEIVIQKTEQGFEFSVREVADMIDNVKLIALRLKALQDSLNELKNEFRAFKECALNEFANLDLKVDDLRGQRLKRFDVEIDWSLVWSLEWKKGRGYEWIKLEDLKNTGLDKVLEKQKKLTTKNLVFELRDSKKYGKYVVKKKREAK